MGGVCARDRYPRSGSKLPGIFTDIHHTFSTLDAGHWHFKDAKHRYLGLTQEQRYVSFQAPRPPSVLTAVSSIDKVPNPRDNGAQYTHILHRVCMLCRPYPLLGLCCLRTRRSGLTLPFLWVDLECGYYAACSTVGQSPDVADDKSSTHGPAYASERFRMALLVVIRGGER